MIKACSICLKDKDDSQFTKYVIKDGTIRSESNCMDCSNAKRRQIAAAKRVVVLKPNAFQKLSDDTQKSVLDKIGVGHLKDHKAFFEGIGLSMSQVYKWHARGYLNAN